MKPSTMMQPQENDQIDGMESARSDVSGNRKFPIDLRTPALDSPAKEKPGHLPTVQRPMEKFRPKMLDAPTPFRKKPSAFDQTAYDQMDNMSLMRQVQRKQNEMDVKTVERHSSNEDIR